MANLVLKNSYPTHGFNASLEIDRKLFSYKKTFVTETKAVDGMPDVKWYMKFCPVDPADPTSFGVYACIESQKEITYTICGKSGSNDGGLNEICILQTKHATIFDTRYNYFIDEKYTVSIGGTFSYKKNEFNNIPKICNPTEWGLRLQENSTEDFNICVGGETIGIHKLIIAAESPAFKKMFEDDFKEARESKVTITDFDAHVAQAFVDYCYGRDISTFVENDADEIKLLYFADKYYCQTLNPQLQIHLSTKLTTQNVSVYVSIADEINVLQLRHACVEFVRNLLYTDNSLTPEEMKSFSIEFMKNVFAFNRNTNN